MERIQISQGSPMNWKYSKKFMSFQKPNWIRFWNLVSYIPKWSILVCTTRVRACTPAVMFECNASRASIKFMCRPCMAVGSGDVCHMHQTLSFLPHMHRLSITHLSCRPLWDVQIKQLIHPRYTIYISSFGGMLLCVWVALVPSISPVCARAKCAWCQMALVTRNYWNKESILTMIAFDISHWQRRRWW